MGLKAVERWDEEFLYESENDEEEQLSIEMSKEVQPFKTQSILSSVLTEDNLV